MESNTKQDVHEKVLGIFRELVQDRAERLKGSRMAEPAMSTVAAALEADYDSLKADEIAFHLTDWNNDAAFIVALHLFPERFSADEINEGISLFLAHVPYHIQAAAKLTEQT